MWHRGLVTTTPGVSGFGFRVAGTGAGHFPPALALKIPLTAHLFFPFFHHLLSPVAIWPDAVARQAAPSLAI